VYEPHGWPQKSQRRTGGLAKVVTGMRWKMASVEFDVASRASFGAFLSGGLSRRCLWVGEGWCVTVVTKRVRQRFWRAALLRAPGRVCW